MRQVCLSPRRGLVALRLGSTWIRRPREKFSSFASGAPISYKVSDPGGLSKPGGGRMRWRATKSQFKRGRKGGKDEALGLVEGTIIQGAHPGRLKTCRLLTKTCRGLQLEV